MELKDIKALIDLMKKNGLSVFKMEKEGFKITLKKGDGFQPVISTPAAPALTTAPAALPATATEATVLKASEPHKEIVSPMVGTFYEAASPEAPRYVEVGQEVTEDTVVCIIEAMKVMNEIKAEARGVVTEILAENGKPVQFGQPLFRLR